MSKKKIFFGFVLIVLIGLGVFLVREGTPLRSTGETQPSKEADVDTVTETSPSPSAGLEREEGSKSRAEETKSEARLIESAPSVAQVREEVAKNPHSTPKSTIAFAMSLAPKFAAARSSPEAAQSFATELEECAEDSARKTTQAIRAFCLKSLMDLGKVAPVTSERAKKFWQSADPEVKKLSE